ncbi:MAG: response regulator [Magnetococcales bacterium]|nr:response regulator [Magnetococcales bacterium]MBF0152106.1 response regulator [Magnetococcales bacterium]MBF0632214.1 response regulator [Magnetococcales bacterium]
MKIMTIDDEPVISQLLEIILEPLGYVLCSAQSGEIALNIFDMERPDLVLLDLHMPDINGTQLVRQLKTQCGERFVPIILLTSQFDDELLADCIDAGGDDLISRPFNQTILEAKLRAWERNIKIFNAMLTSHQNSLSTLSRNTLTSEEIKGLFAWSEDS